MTAKANGISTDLAETLRREVEVYLISQGVNGATDEEIQDALGMEGNTERPRRVELIEAGLVWNTGSTRKSKANRDNTIWIHDNFVNADRGGLNTDRSDVTKYYQVVRIGPFNSMKSAKSHAIPREYLGNQSVCVTIEEHSTLENITRVE